MISFKVNVFCFQLSLGKIMAAEHVEGHGKFCLRVAGNLEKVLVKMLLILDQQPSVLSLSDLESNDGSFS